MYTTIGNYYSFQMAVCCPQDNRQPSERNNNYQLSYTYGFNSWLWAWIRPKHVEVDEEYVVHQVGFSLHDYIEIHGQQNIKKSLPLLAALRTSLLILPLTKNDEERIQNVLLLLQQHLSLW